MMGNLDKNKNHAHSASAKVMRNNAHHPALSLPGKEEARGEMRGKAEKGNTTCYVMY